jgi:hypothetical protein
MPLPDDLTLWSRRFVEDGATSPPPIQTNLGGNVAGSTRKGWSKLGRKGVYPNGRGRFVAKVRHDGQLHYLGTFESEDGAARVAEAKLKELRGE